MTFNLSLAKYCDTAASRFGLFEARLGAHAAEHKGDRNICCRKMRFYATYETRFVSAWPKIAAVRRILAL
jgi:hypothetical protein